MSTISNQWEIEKILAKRNQQGQLQYLVKWAGCTIDECTWEFHRNILKWKERILEFETKLEAIQQKKKEGIRGLEESSKTV